MNFVLDKPPNHEEILEAFPAVRKMKGTVFTYYPHIYNPDGFAMPDHLFAHEIVHLDQQKTIEGARIWWQKYLTDPRFRLEQEIPAYQRQYAFVRKTVKDRNNLFLFLRRIASDLSGPMYGDIISLSEAEELIKNK